MVKRLLILFFLPYCLFAQDLIKVTAQAEGEIYEQEAVKGTITVTHDLAQKVDLKSFKIAGNPLFVQFMKNVPLSNSVVLSLYSFELDPQPKGLHVLPEISVMVAGQRYRAIPATYTVRAKRELPATQAGQLLLQLQAFVDGSTSLYPGQRTTLVYRYLFNTNMDMTKEELPLLDAKGLKKIGKKQFKEGTKNGINILEISQIVEAVKPGTFSFGPSQIQGRAYKEGRFGKKLYAKQKLSAKASTVTLTVHPFPEKNKPTSFNGAIGQFSFNVSLESKDQMAVGDKMVLLITVSGKGQFESVQLPELCCQPGFPGEFRLSDIPPIERMREGAKEFVVEMRPLSSLITEIPSIAFSFFNPESIQYVTLNSKTIPVKVSDVYKEQESKIRPKPQQEKAPSLDKTPSPIEIYGNYPLSEEDLKNTLFGSWRVLLIIPVAVILLIYQWYLRSYLEDQKKKGRIKKAKNYLVEALYMGSESELFYDTLSKSFLLRLKEVGEIEDETVSIGNLPDSEKALMVRSVLEEVEERRFSGEKADIDKYLLRKIKKIFKKL